MGSTIAGRFTKIVSGESRDPFSTPPYIRVDVFSRQITIGGENRIELTFHNLKLTEFELPCFSVVSFPDIRKQGIDLGTDQFGIKAFYRNVADFNPTISAYVVVTPKSLITIPVKD